MTAARKPEKKEDAPRKFNVAVMLDPRVDEQLRVYGADRSGTKNLSAGVARAAEEALKKFGRVVLPEPTRKPTRAALTRGRGRPVVGERRRKRTNVMMYPDLHKLLLAFGAGNVSGGIERAAIAARAVKL
jgi:hypothetical protein